MPIQDRQIWVAWFKTCDGSSRLMPMMQRVRKMMMTAKGIILISCLFFIILLVDVLSHHGHILRGIPFRSPQELLPEYPLFVNDIGLRQAG